MAVVIQVSGRPCLNTHKTKKCYMILTSNTDDTFSGLTTVTVNDSTNVLKWIGQVHDVHDTGKRLQVKLFSEKGTSVAAADDKDAKKDKKAKAGPPLDTGFVTVTLTNPPASVPSVPVDYIDDGTS